MTQLREHLKRRGPIEVFSRSSIHLMNNGSSLGEQKIAPRAPSLSSPGLLFVLWAMGADGRRRQNVQVTGSLPAQASGSFAVKVPMRCLTRVRLHAGLRAVCKLFLEPDLVEYQVGYQLLLHPVLLLQLPQPLNLLTHNRSAP